MPNSNIIMLYAEYNGDILQFMSKDTNPSSSRLNLETPPPLLLNGGNPPKEKKNNIEYVLSGHNLPLLHTEIYSVRVICDMDNMHIKIIGRDKNNRCVSSIYTTTVNSQSQIINKHISILNMLRSTDENAYITALNRAYRVYK